MLPRRLFPQRGPLASPTAKLSLRNVPILGAPLACLHPLTSSSTPCIHPSVRHTKFIPQRACDPSIVANLDRQTGLDKGRRPLTAQEKGAQQHKHRGHARAQGPAIAEVSCTRAFTTLWRPKEHGTLDGVKVTEWLSLSNEGMRSCAIQVREARAYASRQKIKSDMPAETTTQMLCEFRNSFYTRLATICAYNENE